ncbi:MAG: tRNA (guanosine(46)-N7)-methyltransferase TrmB [Candidatus Promineofilum sp.]|nr:tRNA (guanosine(46)-N7)-methyltransferase TrmB [Promineifilum sp.]
MSAQEWYKVEQLPWPADWAALYGRDAPLLLEIGFGSGLFLVELARRLPQANIIGLEISIPSLRNAARKVRRFGLTNVCLLQADARSALQVLCEPHSIVGVFINFPDPWPKKDHLGRRLIDEQFLSLLASRMAPGGVLDIATDHDEYAVQITSSLLRSPYFTSRAAKVFTLADEGRVQTKYEQVALLEGRTPRYYKWRRDDAAVVLELFPIPKELAMPHVVLRLPADVAEIGRRFQPHAVAIDSTRIRFVDAYQSLGDGKLLIETYINEEPLLQRLGLQVRARPTGEIVISLAEVGFPRPTRGVHLAISSLVEWLRAEYPSLVVVQTNLQSDHAHTPHQRY